jgi:Tol biopolymer transport system component
MDTDGTHQRRLTSGFGPDYPDANAPNWSPAGDRIVFWAGHEGLYGDVWTMNADGSRPVRLTREPNPVSSDNPFWSPDGKQILFDTNRGQKPELWVMGSDGSDQRRLLDLGAADNQFSWQPVFDS